MRTKWHVSIHPMGVVCLLAALLFMPIERITAIGIAISSHEAAHLLAIMLCKVKQCSLEWTPLGFVAQAEHFTSLPSLQRLLIAGSGLLASLFLSMVFYQLSVHGSFFNSLFTANLAILLVNALPILPLDGGNVILALAAGLGCEWFVKKTLLFLSYTSAVILAGLGLYGAMNGVLNPTLLLLGPYLAYAARQSSLASGSDFVQMLENRSRKQKNSIRKVEAWAVIGEASPLSLMRTFQQCHHEKFVLFHTINPEDGSLSSIVTQQQMIEKLTDNK